MEWTASYLSDADFLSTLHRLKRGLKPYGLIFVKDSILKGGNQALPLLDPSYHQPTFTTTAWSSPIE